MEDKTDPLFLLIILPAIPIMLTLGKMIRWEDFVLRLWRKHSPKIGLLKYLFGCKYMYMYVICCVLNTTPCKYIWVLACISQRRLAYFVATLN